MNSISDEDQIANTCAVECGATVQISLVHLFTKRNSVDPANAVAVELRSMLLNNFGRKKIQTKNFKNVIKKKQIKIKEMKPPIPLTLNIKTISTEHLYIST